MQREVSVWREVIRWKRAEATFSPTLVFLIQKKLALRSRRQGQLCIIATARGASILNQHHFLPGTSA